jgi:glycosyltransferase involved in cell wall biosynthesis
MGSVRRLLRDLLPGPVRERYHRYALERDFGIDRRRGTRRTTVVDPALPQGLNVVGYWDSPSGIGESARALERAARATGVPVTRIEVPGASPGAAGGARFDVNLYHVNADGAAGAVEELGPAVHAGRANVGYWYWESETFPDRWRDRFDYFDEIWVATDFCRRAIERVSPVPVVVVPPSVLVESAPAPRIAFGVPEKAALVLTIADPSSGIDRKNPLAAARAFARAFSGSSDAAVLVAVCRGAGRVPGLVEELRVAAGGAAVEIIDRTLAREELEGLLAACDAYLSLHRAEGFGFPMAEAMSLGKPVVATDFSGNRDYLNASTGFPVHWSPWTLERAAGPYDAGTRWAEPDEAAAAEALRSVFTNPAGAARRAEAGRRRIRELYAPEVSGTRIASTLHSLRARLRSAS